VRQVMVENIERVLERGEKIELLVDKTESLNHQAFKFRKQARSVRRFMWLKNMKIIACGVFLVMLAGLVISMLICGIDYSHCSSEGGKGGDAQSPSPSPRPNMPPPGAPASNASLFLLP